MFLGLAAACSPALAATEKFADADTLGRWISYYYARPEPLRVDAAIHAASAQGFMRNGTKAAPFIGFIAGVVTKTPALARPLAEQLASLPDSDQPVVIFGLWYSAHAAAPALLQKLATAMPAHKEMIDRLLGSARLRLLDMPLEQGPWVLDALWGYFMATGDVAPLGRIMTALPWVNLRGDEARLALGGAAKGSLISHAVQHERVMAACRKGMNSQPPAVRKVLGEVIASAEQALREAKTR